MHFVSPVSLRDDINHQNEEITHIATVPVRFDQHQEDDDPSNEHDTQAASPAEVTTSPSQVDRRIGTCYSRGESLSVLPEQHTRCRDFIGIWFHPDQKEELRAGIAALSKKLQENMAAKMAIEGLRKEAKETRVKVTKYQRKLRKISEAIKIKEHAANLAMAEEEVSNGGVSCPVCKLVPPSMILTPCGHTVCDKCDEVWGKISSICPTCAQEKNWFP